MRRLHPPTGLLLAFVTTARFGSVSRAAEALALSQSAVSKQVLELERWLGVTLFERVRRRLVLTAHGAHYEGAVRPVLAQLESATLELLATASGGGSLRVSSLPTFAAKWLIPRLPRFRQQEPKVELMFVPYVQGYDFTRADLDCAIRYGDGNWPGAHATYLTGRRMSLIAPPGIRLRSPRDIARHSLLQHVSVPQAWGRWCEAHQVHGVNPLMGPQLDQYHSLIRAVMAGMGLALVPECLVEEDVKAGLVDAPLNDAYTDPAGYYLCTPHAKTQLRSVSAFRNWLVQECLVGGEGCKPLPTAVSTRR